MKPLRKTHRAVGSGLFLLLFAIPLLCLGQASSAEEGAVIRINGNVTLGPDEREGAVVVIQGNATIAGEADVVVVVDGLATLNGARVAELIVVQGQAHLLNGTVVTGDVELINSALSREEGVIVGGQVHYTAGRFGRGLLVFGLLFGLGTALAVLVSGLLLAGVAGRLLARRTLRPVAAAAEVAEAITGGRRDARLPEGADEFGAWAASFNRMADTVQETIGQLEPAIRARTGEPLQRRAFLFISSPGTLAPGRRGGGGRIQPVGATPGGLVWSESRA